MSACKSILACSGAITMLGCRPSSVGNDSSDGNGDGDGDGDEDPGDGDEFCDFSKIHARDPLWLKSPQEAPGDSQLFGNLVVADGALFLGGYYDSANAGVTGGFVARRDLNGAVVSLSTGGYLVAIRQVGLTSYRTVGTLQDFPLPLSIVERPDGFLLAGAYDFGKSTPWIGKLDPAGVPVWHEPVEPCPSEHDPYSRILSMIEVMDHLWFVAEVEVAPHELRYVIVELNHEGELVDSFRVKAPDSSTSLRIASDGEAVFAIGTFGDGEGGPKSWLARLQ